MMDKMISFLFNTSGFNPNDWVVNKTLPLSSIAIQSDFVDPLSTNNFIILNIEVHI